MRVWKRLRLKQKADAITRRDGWNKVQRSCGISLQGITVSYTKDERKRESQSRYRQKGDGIKIRIRDTGLGLKLARSDAWQKRRAFVVYVDEAD